MIKKVRIFEVITENEFNEDGKICLANLIPLQMMLKNCKSGFFQILVRKDAFILVTDAGGKKCPPEKIRNSQRNTNIAVVVIFSL